MLIEKAKKILLNGGIIVYPTETLYGIGADPFNENAVLKVFNLKKRPFNLPLSIAVSNIKMMNKVAKIDKITEKFYKKYLPGPYTLILKKRQKVSNLITSGLKTVGVRVPDNDFILELIEDFGPITSTSANIHGKNLPTNIEISKKQFGNKVDLYIDEGECKFKNPSTIIDMENKKILRKGALHIDLEEIYGK